MGSIEELVKIDWVLVVLAAFSICFSAKEIIELFSYFRRKFRIKFGYEADKCSVEDRLEKLERQYDEIMKIADGVEEIGKQLTEMQIKMDETEMAKLKNSIVNYYKKYKDAKEWSRLESDAFWNLFQRYEAHGGNGYCHTIIEPIMRELNIVD